MRTFYVNGQYVPEDQATVSVLDRGFLFADAVYEVTAVIGGKLLDYAGHVQRLQRSLSELDMPMPLSEAALLAAHRELVTRNHIHNGLIYLQVSRGVAERDFTFPAADTPQTVVLFTQDFDVLNHPKAKDGIRVRTVPDLRWQRGDIKTVQLLYASHSKSRATADGYHDVWFTHDGLITEGSSNNTFIVSANGEIITRHLSTQILAGITRQAVLTCADELGLSVVERGFSPEEAQQAIEAFSTSAGSFVMPVVELDDKPIGNGKVGEITLRLRELYINLAREQAI